MKRSKASKQAHTSDSKIGMGDFYGQAVKQPIGIMKRDYLNGSLPNPKKAKAPKALA